MKIINTLFLTTIFFLFSQISYAQICDPLGNVVIFSNYDGSRETVAGRLNINVDVNIPNLKIGICSYERVTVNIGGAFAANVTKVIYAGLNGTVNCNCYWPAKPPGCTATTVITGVPAGIISYFYSPPATLADPNGNPNIICSNGSCSSGPSGGCNTSGQIVHYFLTNFGAGSKLRSHDTQYNCWAGVTKNISTSGNCCINPLPINLLSFKSTCIYQNKRIFEWSTASEINNDYFTIERSVNGIDYSIVTTVKGAGNSNQVINYQWIDDSFLSGTYYYRLKQTDYDGRSEYFNPISVKAVCGNSPFQLNLYNNTADNKLVFQLNTDVEENVSLIVYDIFGRTVINKYIIASKGNNSYTLDINSIANGIYFLSVKTKEYSAQQKFIKK